MLNIIKNFGEGDFELCSWKFEKGIESINKSSHEVLGSHLAVFLEVVALRYFTPLDIKNFLRTIDPELAEMLGAHEEEKTIDQSNSICIKNNRMQKSGTAALLIIDGYINFDTYFNIICKTHKFYIVKGLIRDCSLGRDFMNSFEIQLSFGVSSIPSELENNAIATLQNNISKDDNHIRNQATGRYLFIQTIKKRPHFPVDQGTRYNSVNNEYTFKEVLAYICLSRRYNCVFRIGGRVIHLRQIFQALSEGGFTVNGEKSRLSIVEIKYLGYIFSKDGIRVNPDRVKEIFDDPTRANTKEVRKFLGWPINIHTSKTVLLK
ncbi:hypothetical protein RF11_12444 [Thelohanellus kitauei]|uniref:Uncharacterized protein n=1 Tax=Thelohanellus kitauei TaxID=669202 RepID=A0A0C2N642_THEKT|nr:hypothetical protein RF11_12444 [Thelohanellus kitauei]